MYTIAISGPKKNAAKVEVALEDADIPVYPSDHHAPMQWASKFPDDTDEFVTVQHADVDHVTRAIAKTGWRVRMHYPVPEPPEPSPTQLLTATLADMRAEIDALKARLA